MAIPPGIGFGKGHGGVERGLTSSPRSRRFEGRFGRLFRSLPPADFPDAALIKLATAMTAEAEPEVTPETEIDDEENSGLPAGYTYYGQFIDHDITFDPLSSLVKLNDPDGLTDFRTPALDLDCLYGRGPDDQPYMYDPSGRKFLLGDRLLTGGAPPKPLTRDLPRFHGRALIGDKRNDENVIVSQLQGLFLRFHNFLADGDAAATFREVQRAVRWHHQWLVLFDFLPRIVGRDRVEALLPHVKSGKSLYDDPPRLHFFHWHNQPFMPVEFSGAAYRFGHSMVRPVYRLSKRDLPSTVNPPGLDGRKAVFAPIPDDGLNGFREFPADFAIDWRLFLDTPGHKLTPGSTGKERVQPAYKIDTSLVSPLGALPEFSQPGTNDPKDGPSLNVLAFRNLSRGVALQLPSGQDVARQLALHPIADADLLVGKANASGLKTNRPITDLDPAFAGRAPLWFYVLAEAQDQWRQESKGKKTDAEKNAVPTRLGPVGARIVGEVLIGLVLGDNDSFLATDPNWKPLLGNPKAGSVFDRFTLGDLFEAVPPV